jgi:hypothetical protein
MGKPAAVKASKAAPAHWPFDPLQPGDHEPVRLPEEASRVQKQTGAGRAKRSAGPTKRSKR